MPLDPPNFSVANLRGRGQAQVVREPADGGTAIIRVEDSDGGSAVYSFNMNWDNRAVSEGSGQDSIFGTPGQNRRNAKSADPMTSAEAVEACQDQIMQQASSRFGMSNAFFRRTTIENSGKNVQQVRGTLDVKANGGQSQRYRFTCAVNLNNGRVRSAQLDRSPVGQNARDAGFPNRNATATSNLNRAMQNCEDAVDRRLNEQELTRIGPATIDIDDTNGSSRVSGSATVADRNQRQRIVDFGCTVTLATGAVDTVDVLARR